MIFDPNMIRGMAEPIVMSLVKDKPMYGYEIIKNINEETGGKFQWKEGTLYPCLHRLENEGLIDSEWSLSAEGRKRKYYQITRKGKKILNQKVAEWSTFSNLVNSLIFTPGMVKLV